MKKKKGRKQTHRHYLSLSFFFLLSYRIPTNGCAEKQKSSEGNSGETRQHQQLDEKQPTEVSNTLGNQIALPLARGTVLQLALIYIYLFYFILFLSLIDCYCYYYYHYYSLHPKD
jgi:hypothetical protein